MTSVSRGFSRLKELAKEIPPSDEIRRMLLVLRDTDDHTADRVAAIVGAAFLEAALETAILSKFIPLDEEEERPGIFENGPLRDFSSRIKMAYALSLYGKETSDELHCIRVIRNAFAHGALTLSFKTKEIADICAQLSLFEKSTLSEALFGDAPKDRYISTVMFITSRLRYNLSHPTAHRPKNASGWANWAVKWGQLT